MLKKSLISVVLLNLLACSAAPNLYSIEPTAFLFIDGVQAEEIKKVETILIENGFNLSLSELSIPSQIDSHTIIYSALLIDRTVIESLENSLNLLGYNDIFVTIGTKGNHSYTKNDLGVYLINPTPKIAEQSSTPHIQKVELPDSYDGRCPSYDANLNLYAYDAFVLEILIWDSDLNEYESTYKPGIWTQSENTVTLELENQAPVEFKIEDYEVNFSSGTGRNKGIQLIDTSDGTIFEGCKFIYSAITP